ncbi:tRNA (adenosine(37)-N6)-dimethylallyltransferase MiaA [Amnibacterium flavum]|uniref:tRNA dimethylallyltransferase n=1 Tax=Amnibacterium flavum TaxID=2173173 RepID=A0A2V1HLJ3_9MICO|nr:tRNA (adenosine(37)-N6)-dimethylallyltransferase MiaA [Amnibacterium flavum]PVZ93516.1 tRNA (adenosine(37)-N6)-dimethylallyltransferase MiaA [Amnibacterium flavum]
MNAAVPLIVIAGPTGTGKSALSLDLADSLAGRGTAVEIVNADAMQLYRGMDIGTAKLSPDERRGIPHHLFDVLEVDEVSTVADYQSRARRAVESIRARGAVPILVGGSGLYISALIHDFQFPGTDEGVRGRLERELEADGAAAIWRRLAEADPAAADAIDPANGRRAVRALEVIELTGRPYSATLPEGAAFWTPTEVVLLDVPLAGRPELKQRLAGRAQAMFDGGLLDEVRALLPKGLAAGPTASRAIGYAQAIAVLEQGVSVDDAVTETTALTWRYLRRQRSWFGRYRDAHRIDITAGEPLREALDLLAPKLGA